MYRKLIVVLCGVWLGHLLAPPVVQAQSSSPSVFVGLRSGRMIYPETITLRERGFGGSYLILDGRDQVLLSDVLYFQNAEGYFIYEPIEGASRPTLMMREFVGRISLYSVTKQVYESNTGYNPYRMGGYRNTGSWRQKTEYFFRKDNGPVVRYNYRNLRIALSDNPDSYALLQEVGRRRFIMYSLYGAGGVLSIMGMLTSLQEGRPPTYTWVGIGLLTVPTFLGTGIDAKMEQALLIYNKAGEEY